MCTSMSSRDQSAAVDLTPLSPAVFHILLSLGEGERHGYAIKREISLRTGGRLKLGPGVLYGSINKMLELGLIEESADRPDPHLDMVFFFCGRSKAAIRSSAGIARPGAGCKGPRPTRISKPDPVL